MPRSAAALLLAIALPSTGCLFDILDREDEPERDGADCDHDEDCKSGACRGGMCMASSCNVTGNCEAGFVCDMAPTWAEVLSLGFAKGACLPDCNTCPQDEPRWSCGGTTCDYDANPHIAIVGTPDGIVGDPIQLEVTIELDHGREVERIEWMQHGMVVSTEATAEIVLTAPGIAYIDVVVTDDGYGYASAQTTVTACAEQGDACYYVGDCCTGLECNATGVCE